MNKAGYNAVSGITLIQAKNSLKEELQQYYQLKRQATGHRDIFLESLAQAQATVQQKHKVKHLQTLRLREQQ